MIKIKTNNAQGFEWFEWGGCLDALYPASTTRRGRVKDNGMTAPTIQATGEVLRMENRYRIRRLTPRECGRLMGVKDEEITKMQSVNSDTQLFKQYGNSIVVDVLVAMMKNLNFKELENGKD